jgi:hypothetical protein
MKNKLQAQANLVCQHISTIIDDRRRTPGLIAEVQRWMYASGPEWTVLRLKSLKNATIQYLATQQDKAKALRKFPTPKWVARDNRGFPKGAIGTYIRDHVDGSPREIGKVLSLLNVYTAFVSQTVTRKQEVKFLEAIAGPVPVGQKKAVINLFTESRSFMAEDLVDWIKLFQTNYRETFSFAGLNSSKPSLYPQFRDAKEWHPWVLSLIESTMVTGPWTSILEKMGVPIIPGAQMTPHVGRITVLQEKGFKARVIAMPVAGAQVAFKPLHIALNAILRRIPEDCTHDQLAGVRWAEEELRLGKTVHAVDLSSATDNFPVDFQISLLKLLGYQHADKFLQMAKSQWSSDYGNLTYTKGQPMGLYGSFSLFALSHHFLIRMIERSLGKVNTYRILGDDIVISDNCVVRLYRQWLSALSVPISVEKCVTSDLITEFAGNVITPNGVIPTVKSPTKGRWIPVQSFINYARVTGKITRMTSVPKQYRALAIALASLPHYYGGAGVNPQGLPLESRLNSFEEALARTTIPMSRDIRWTLLKFHAGKHPWVRKVVTYLHEQCKSRDQLLVGSIAKKSGGLINLPTELFSLYLQVFGDEAEGLVYEGQVSTPSRDDALRQWRSLKKRMVKHSSGAKGFDLGF